MKNRLPKADLREQEDGGKDEPRTGTPATAGRRANKNPKPGWLRGQHAWPAAEAEALASCLPSRLYGRPRLDTGSCPRAANSRRLGSRACWAAATPLNPPPIGNWVDGARPSPCPGGCHIQLVPL